MFALHASCCPGQTAGHVSSPPQRLVAQSLRPRPAPEPAPRVGAGADEHPQRHRDQTEGHRAGGCQGDTSATDKHEADRSCSRSPLPLCSSPVPAPAAIAGSEQPGLERAEVTRTRGEIYLSNSCSEAGRNRRGCPGPSRATTTAALTSFRGLHGASSGSAGLQLQPNSDPATHDLLSRENKVNSQGFSLKTSSTVYGGSCEFFSTI